ncbi:hypothetical protein L1887_42632 [Cichorium endivia]|nr:hypothetical protein L1887_42632 [Cichorium endivia]
MPAPTCLAHAFDACPRRRKREVPHDRLCLKPRSVVSGAAITWKLKIRRFYTGITRRLAACQELSVVDPCAAFSRRSAANLRSLCSLRPHLSHIFHHPPCTSTLAATCSAASVLVASLVLLRSSL